MPDQEAQWFCEAYGPEKVAIGALCFVAEPGSRVCGSPAVCHQTMIAARQQLFRRIQERAAEGDETAQYLAGEFTSPEQLLGGGEAEGASPDE